MTGNVLSSWIAHFVFIVGGFIIPRMIKDHLGDPALGVWDFGWAVTAYFALVTGGLISSVNRYVARHRAASDIEAVNRTVSSVTCVLLVMAVIVMALTVTATFSIPRLLSEKLGEFAQDGQWVVFFLGSSLAVQIALSGYGGVLTGCHRWGLYSALDAGTYVAAFIGMLAALLLGGGLRELALANLCGMALGWGTGSIIAYRVCRGLHVRLRYAQWSTARRMLGFGSKTFIPHIAELLMSQTIAILVMAYLGPAPLAHFARPRSLVRHVRLLVMKYALVLTPTASSLEAMELRTKLQALLITAGRTALYIALPLIATLILLGGPILRLWMGPSYELGLLLAVLAGGHLALIAFLPVRTVLQGLNAHGRPGLANLIAAVLAVGLGAFVLDQGWGIVGVAVAISLPLTLANGLYVPAYACRRLGVPLKRFLLETTRGPVLCAVPFCLCLGAARIALPGKPFAGLALGLATGGAVLIPLYWRYALPAPLKAKLIKPFQNLPFFG
jgi:O-antigen/teichoic acid export membrane protein